MMSKFSPMKLGGNQKYRLYEDGEASRHGDEEDVSLIEHKRGPKTQKLRAHHELWKMALVIFTIAASFLGGLLVGQRAKPMMWNFDSVHIVPSIIADYLRRTDAGVSFPSFTATPQTRDADPDLADHPWRQPPSAEQKAFYKENFGHGKVFLISAKDMERMGKDPKQYAHIGEDWGYGDKIYPARLDHTHQMHCLHVLHTMLHPTYYRKNATEDGGIHPLEMNHGEHCIWALFDYISCHVSWDVYNFRWIDGIPRPYPDHSSQRQCRDWTPMNDFYLENDVSTDARIRYLIPQEGDYIHPMTEEQLVHGAAIRKAAPEGVLLEPDEWLDERRMRFEKAMEEWHETGEIPRAPDRHT